MINGKKPTFLDELESLLKKYETGIPMGELKKSMSAIASEKDQLQFYISDLQGKVNISFLEQKEALDRKYMYFINLLQKVYHHLIRLMEKFRSIDQLVASDESVQSVFASLERFKEFSELFGREFASLESKTREKQQAIRNLQSVVGQLASQLKRQNQQNFAEIQKIIRMQAILFSRANGGQQNGKY